MRCPHCQGLSTKRNGKTRSTPQGFDGPGRPLQRFICNDCRKTFTSGRTAARPGARFTVEVVREAVRRYVQGLTSYRTLAVMLSRQLDVSVSRFTLNSWVDEAGGQAPTPLEVLGPAAPAGLGWDPRVDGKVIWVGGEERCLLLGVDQTSQDIVHRLVLDAENAEGFHQLIHEAVTIAGYPLSGLVIDSGPGWVEVWRDYFSKVPLQLCRIHFDRRLDQDIPKLKRSAKAPLNAELKTRIRRVLYAEDYRQACRAYYPLISERDRYQGVGRHDSLGSLARRFNLYMTHHRVAGMPADANVSENVIKQLNKKLRLMEGFATLDSCGTVHPAAGRLLPGQAVHRLVRRRAQRSQTPRACWRRSRRGRLARPPPRPLSINDPSTHRMIGPARTVRRATGPPRMTVDLLPGIPAPAAPRPHSTRPRPNRAPPPPITPTAPQQQHSTGRPPTLRTAGIRSWLNSPRFERIGAPDPRRSPIRCQISRVCRCDWCSRQAALEGR